MTILEIRQQKKNKALNTIISIHSKFFKYEDDYFDEDNGTCVEQRDRAVKMVLNDLECELNELKRRT